MTATMSTLFNVAGDGALEATKGDVMPVPTFKPKYGPTPKSNNFATNDDLFFGVERHKPAQPHCPTSASCQEYVFKETLAPAIRAFVTGKNLFLIGAPGAGKTLTARWLANELGSNLYTQSHNAHTQADELGVQMVQGEDGQWHHDLGKVLTPFKHGGVLLLDELAAVKDAGVGKFYYPILNRDPITVMTDNGLELIYPHPEFRVVATGNHWNRTTGNYELGEALADRVIFIECSFLEPEIEIPMLVKDAPSMPPGTIRDLVTFANRTRDAAAVAESSCWSLSTRVLRSLVTSVEHAGNSLAEAVDMHIFSTLRVRYPAQYESLQAIFNDIVTM